MEPKAYQRSIVFAMDLDSERESILGQEATPTQKVRKFINRALELQLDRNQWQTLVWTLPGDILDAIGRIRQQEGRLAQPDIVFSSNHLQLIQQAVAANLSANPYFLNFVNSHIPADTPTKSELAQLRKVCQSRQQARGRSP